MDTATVAVSVSDETGNEASAARLAISLQNGNIPLTRHQGVSGGALSRSTC